MLREKKKQKNQTRAHTHTENRQENVLHYPWTESNTCKLTISLAPSDQGRGKEKAIGNKTSGNL